MQPLEKYLMTDDTSEPDRDPITQLSFAYRRSEGALNDGASDALVEGIRRAEAILFAAGEPLSADQIAETLPHGVEAAEVLMALRAQYVNRGVNLVEVAGKWRFQTASDLAYLFVEERQVQRKLGQASLETLAIIAYGQPVTRAEVEAVRGVAVSKTTIDTLLETGWVKIKGRRKTPGQPITYGTTDAFMEHFGLESLDTLPGKADLEAEGLLSDVIPDGFQMPDEEALNGEELPDHESGEIEETDSFVTDFMDDVDEEDNDTAETVSDEAGAVEAGAVEAEADTELEADEVTHDSAVSVFAYTRAPDRSQADEDEFDSSDVKAAVIRLTKQPRIPEQPMDSWDDDE
jgi:segregation and condensation protein B